MSERSVLSLLPRLEKTIAAPLPASRAQPSWPAELAAGGLPKPRLPGRAPAARTAMEESGPPPEESGERSAERAANASDMLACETSASERLPDTIDWYLTLYVDVHVRVAKCLTEADWQRYLAASRGCRFRNRDGPQLPLSRRAFRNERSYLRGSRLWWSEPGRLMRPESPAELADDVACIRRIMAFRRRGGEWPTDPFTGLSPVCVSPPRR